HWQAQVEHHRVESFHVAQVVCGLTVGGAVYGVSASAQRLFQLRGQRGFVFDEQDSHQWSPRKRTFLPLTASTRPSRASIFSLSRLPLSWSRRISYRYSPSSSSNSTLTTWPG